MKFTLEYPSEFASASEAFLTPDAIRTIVRRAEAAGFGAVAVSEHPAPSVKWRRNGGHDTLDPVAALSFMAGLTETITLMTNLMVLPFRNPYMAAKALASIDVVSGGRLIVGAGVGYLRSEFSAVGVEFERRGRLLDESLAALSAIWTAPEEPVRGADFAAVGPVWTQSPVQKPHPPIWIGGNSVAARRRVVEYGSGWMPLIAPPTVASSIGTQALTDVIEFGAAVCELGAQLEAAGRDPSTVDVQIEQHLVDLSDAGAVSAVVDGLAELECKGATWAVVHVDASSPEASVDYIEAFAENFIR
ncbi:TIGR03619 family F420-dependent LLM class oxidoreductase [Mycolicibacterium hodleri]|uniref:TIGR03619 family F420-dependent LLM class oxidoreductase n=1 Tax=Mycolicibacterium hodleri TaxID=49897 RepID=A0A502EFY0_9MYCO|nr:TIGR03619 family F420-dependent LLM class oxidoreductase [Mycolicibacterium hodleri]TPG36633.1 TIGR03619 family F420-dependent LLM class oxidoreductase [Mycolicibacterium hodleri]